MTLQIGDKIINEKTSKELWDHMESYYSNFITFEILPFKDILQLETQEELFQAIIDLEDFEILTEHIQDHEIDDNIKIRYYIKPSKEPFSSPETLMFHLERELEESIFE